MTAFKFIVFPGFTLFAALRKWLKNCQKSYDMIKGLIIFKDMEDFHIAVLSYI